MYPQKRVNQRKKGAQVTERFLTRTEKKTAVYLDKLRQKDNQCSYCGKRLGWGVQKHVKDGNICCAGCST